MVQDRIALVTGASRGIGRATALRLARDGTAVAINYNASEGAARAVREAITAAGGRAVTVRADVRDQTQLAEMLDRVERDLGPIDVLVNNAGFVRDRLLLRLTADDWDSVWETNYAAVAWLTEAVLPSMASRGWGRVINLSSIVGIAGNAGQANYATAKGAIAGLTQDLAITVAGAGVTVNCIAPGYISTDATAAMAEQYREAWLGQIPMGRWGEPAEIAAVVAFLASDEASYLTGQCLIVDGGLLAGRG